MIVMLCYGAHELVRQRDFGVVVDNVFFYDENENFRTNERSRTKRAKIIYRDARRGGGMRTIQSALLYEGQIAT